MSNSRPFFQVPLAALTAMPALTLGLAAGPAAAAEPTGRTGVRAPAAEKAAPSVTRPPPRPAARGDARAARTPAAAQAVLRLPAAGGEQLAAAALAHFGEHACEFRQTLQVSLNLDHAGYLDVLFGDQYYVMKPVLSSTGALRLEDVGGRMLLLQIAFKSMLMDVRSGRRVADECVHETHRVARQEAERAPPQPGLGIAPAPAGGASAPPA
jgi:hypothetical protein